jgi:hypothetical protein
MGGHSRKATGTSLHPHSIFKGAKACRFAGPADERLRFLKSDASECHLDCELNDSGLGRSVGIGR